MAEKVLEGKKVAFVSGDLGGYGDALPIVKKLQEMGAEIHYFIDPDGAAKKKAEKAGISFETREPNRDEDINFDLIIIGVSHSAPGLQIAWTEFGATEVIMVVWIEDMPGTSVTPKVSDVLEGNLYPDIIFSSEEIGAVIAREFYSLADVFAFGKTTFEGLDAVRADKEKIRAKIRAEKGIGEDDFVITFWSGGNSKDRVFSQVETITQSIHRTGMAANIKFAPRLHPKLDDNFGSGTVDNLWEKTIGMADAYGISIIDFRGMDAEDVICASDITIGDWGGNENTRSTVLGVPAIITLFPDDTEDRENRGYENGVPPIIRAEAALGAKNGDELRLFIEYIFNGDQETMMRLSDANPSYAEMGKPGATDRIVAKIVESIF